MLSMETRCALLSWTGRVQMVVAFQGQEWRFWMLPVVQLHCRRQSSVLANTLLFLVCISNGNGTYACYPSQVYEFILILYYNVR